MKIYIKFLHKEDIYALNPFFESPHPEGEPKTPLMCGRCGGTLYIPVELPEGAEVTKPMGGTYRPFPLEKPHLIWRSEPELPTLSWPISGKERLKSFHSVIYVDDDIVYMSIEDIRMQPVKHICKDLKGRIK